MTKANTNPSKVNWKQAAGEAFLLLLGVILALAGQAWWESRVERKVIDEYVVNLLAEARENQAGLRKIIDRHNSYIALGTELLHVLQSEPSAESSASLKSLTSKLGYFQDFRPATSALDNLIGAGGMGLLESVELQHAVSKYAQSLKYHNVVQAELVDYCLNTFFPFLSDHVPMIEIGFVNGVPDMPQGSRFEFDPQPLTDSLQYENLVVRRISAEGDAIQFATIFLGLSDELVQLLQQER